MEIVRMKLILETGLLKQTLGFIELELFVWLKLKLPLCMHGGSVAKSYTSHRQ